MSDTVTYEQNTVITDPNAVSDEVQKWTLTGVGAAKKWTVELDGEKSTAAALVGNATAATVQAELLKLSNINSGDLTVSGEAGGGLQGRGVGDVQQCAAQGAGMGFLLPK